MTKEEIRKILDNTKVYVNGKSKEIQEKLFSFGYGWFNGSCTKVIYENKPFLFIDTGGKITFGDDMNFFIEEKNKEITAEKILSLEVTEPSYRPFKTKEECWNEMQKHQPFGWLINNMSGSYVHPILYCSTLFMFDKGCTDTFDVAFNHYTIPDGAPFGIKEE